MVIANELTKTRRGAWIINASKHLVHCDATDFRFRYFERLIFAGKCGSLLIKLSSDNEDQLQAKQVEAHASVCGIRWAEQQCCLDTLRVFGCIEWDSSATTYTVLAFSRQRVLETTASILVGSIGAQPLETVLPELLEFCLLRPRLEVEAKDFLTSMLDETDTASLLNLVSAFGLLDVSRPKGIAESIYYNEYQFGDKIDRITKALSALDNTQREELNSLIEQISEKPGILPESVRASQKTKDLAIALGLIEVSEVRSPAGSACFLTMPHLAPPSVGRVTEHLEDDVFHHAKMLLSSLRFGELRSQSSRGRISDPPVLVNALLTRDRVGPCTAIGQDYVLLEAEGVIRTVSAPGKPGQRYMQLRRKEPAEMVLGLLRSGNSSAIDARSLPVTLELPTNFSGPENARLITARRVAQTDERSYHDFLEALRT